MLPNKEWEIDPDSGDGTTYNTQDNVFIPSSTELGDTEHILTHEIGSVYPYFHEPNDTDHIAYIGGYIYSYWTRSPITFHGS